jgi:hypothetical protein
VPILAAMLLEGLLHKVGVAVLALTLLVATAPLVAAAPALGPPCDCPSVHMPMATQGMRSHSTPSTDHKTPCNNARNCICAVSCGAVAYIPQVVAAVPGNLESQQANLIHTSALHGISLSPAIRPPILRA